MEKRLSVHRISKTAEYKQGYRNSSILERESERVRYINQRIAWHLEEIEDMKGELDKISLKREAGL